MTMRPPGRVTRTISLATSNGFGANIAPKMLTTRSKLWSLEVVQVARVALLELQVRQALLGRALVAGLHEVPRDVDAQDVGAERAPPAGPSSRRRSRGRGRGGPS